MNRPSPALDLLGALCLGAVALLAYLIGWLPFKAWRGLRNLWRME
jgi:hypothetical protein